MNKSSGFVMFIIVLVAAALVVLGVVFSLAHAQEANITRYDKNKYLISVYDGDTFHVMDGYNIVDKVRLWGYDAPELKEKCRDAEWKSYRCGDEARKALAELISRTEIVVCEEKGKSYDRKVMKCLVGSDTGSIDIGEAMVRSGHGEAVRKYTEGTDYGKKLQRLQREAQDFKRGIWKVY